MAGSSPRIPSTSSRGTGLRRPRSPLLALSLSFGLIALHAFAVDPLDPDLDRLFQSKVRPFLETFCFDCHGQDKQKGKLNLSLYGTAAEVAADHPRWAIMLEKLEAKEMPPEDAKQFPTPEQRHFVIGWIKNFRQLEAKRHAGDPGYVPIRRLSNAEYNHTIRDLTGVDIQPALEFPVDPANQAGFDNSGESLAMSPALLKKYLAAARQVAEHVVLQPAGFVFAPHPAVTESDRDKYCVRRIVDFYNRHQVDYTDYFFAAWQFQHRPALGRPMASLADLAAEAGISPRYLAMIWSVLTENPDEVGPISTLQSMWRELPIPQPDRPDSAREGCRQMRKFVLELRPKLTPTTGRVGVKGISAGSQTFVLWQDRQQAENRMRFKGRGDKDSERPGSKLSYHRFCEVFPDAFFVPSRGSYADPNQGSQVRLLSAGFHLMHGYFRDDLPLYELVLSEADQSELDTLWQELDFITFAPMRQYKDFIFFERAEPPRFMIGSEFDFARSEDKDAISEVKIRRLAELYLAEARRHDPSEQALEAIETYFTNISSQIRSVEEARPAAKPSHLQALQLFAERAYRRPLSSAERDDLLGFYHSLRDQGAGHEEAIRDTISSILVSPYFCYRIDLPQPGPGVRPLSDYALASRLSYFLWASMPDTELFAEAAAGRLHLPEVLIAQARRMLDDDRVRGLATEFAGNWLDFRRFEEHNAVDRERFKNFDNDLRQAMFEEPIRFFIDLIRNNRSVLEFLYANHTFVNRVLANHYGIPDSEVRPDHWIRIDDGPRYGRGGLLPMSVFLTKNAPGLRTSPVKRGYWVVRRLLGEYIPAPPPNVPELPADEAKTGDLTLPQLLSRHRQDKNCAKCHDRFDALGLVFEGYGPVGELRTLDLGGRPVQIQATFPDGSEGVGLDGLRAYLRGARQEEFIDNLCRKLLAYALSRSLSLPDELILEEMRTGLEADHDRFGSLIESIVTSPQFLTHRGRQDLSNGATNEND